MKINFELESINFFFFHYHMLANSETYWAAAAKKTTVMVSLNNFDGKLKITIPLL